MTTDSAWLRTAVVAAFVGILGWALWRGLTPPGPRSGTRPSGVEPENGSTPLTAGRRTGETEIPVSPVPRLPVSPVPVSPAVAPPVEPAAEPALDWQKMSPAEKAAFAWTTFEREATREGPGGAPRVNRELSMELYDELKRNSAAWPLLAEQARTAKHPRARAWALAVLRDLARPEDRPVFEACLKDADAAVRENAARGLLNLKDAEADAVLRTHLSGESAERVRKAIEEGLKGR